MANLSEYKGLKLGKEVAPKATEEEVNKELTRLQNNPKAYAAKDDVASIGDVVTIDFEGFVDGVAFEGGKGENYDLTLGSGTFIPGFEDQLVGHKAGEDVDVNVTFPENYQAENLKGKKALFKCKVHAVKSKPALDDAFAQKVGIASLKALREEIEREISMRHEDEAFNKYVEKVSENIISNSNIEVSNEELNAKYDEMIRYYDAEFARQGITLEKYLEISGSSLDTFKETMKPQASKSVQIDKLFTLIGEKENLIPTEEDINNRLNAYTTMYNIPLEKVKEFFADGKMEDLKKDLLQNKVAKFLFENNN